MIGRNIRWRDVRYHWGIYLFAVPTILLVALFQYYPAASGILHSFFRWNGADIAEFVGLDNYRDLVSNSEFWLSFKVALVLGAWNVLKMIPALFTAVCIHRCSSQRLQFFYRAMFVVPMVVPGLVIVLIWRSFFFEATNGYLNRFLDATGIMQLLSMLNPEVFVPGKSPAWLGDPRLILASCIVWGFPWVGSFAVLTYLAKLQGIPRAIYEAAAIDGVGWFRKFTHIELPLIMGSIHLLLVFVIIDTLKDAGMILALAGFEGGPGGVVTVPALYMLRKAFIDQQMGYACAVGIILTILVMVLQKLSMSTTRFGTMGRAGQWLVRGVLAVFAGLLFWAGLRAIATLLLLAVVPWGKVRGAIDRFKTLHRAAGETDAWRALPATGAVDSAADRRRAIGSWMLRAAKHGFIWLVLAFAFLPLYLMLIVSFKSNPQVYEAPAVITQPLHVENWHYAWTVVAPTVANSIFISTAATALALLFAVCAAYFFARHRMPMSGFLWNALLILMMMPAIANLVPLFRLLKDLNLLNTLSALILVGASAGQVFAIFVLREFIADLPRGLFEAAEIDGAGHFQQLRTVVVPLSGPIVGTVGVMLFIQAWNDFILPLIIMRDQSRLPVMVQLLRMAGEYIVYWGPLMAGYALASIPVIILFLFCMKLFIRGLSEGGLKG